MPVQKYFTDRDTIMVFFFNFKINVRPFRISFFVHGVVVVWGGEAVGKKEEEADASVIQDLVTDGS